VWGAAGRRGAGPGGGGVRGRRAVPGEARGGGDRPRRGVLDGGGRGQDARRVRGARAGEADIVARPAPAVGGLPPERRGAVGAGTVSPASAKVGLRQVRVVAILVSLLCGVSTAGAAELERLPAVLHVHSPLSTGDFSFGVAREGLEALPVTGNMAAGGFAWTVALDLVPGLLLIPGALLLVAKRRAVQRVGHGVVLVRRRRWLPGGFLCAVGALALARAWPFTVDPYPPYSDLGLA